MHLLTLSLVQFGVTLGVSLALTAALYLIDRAQKRRVVSTMRFWEAAAGSVSRKSRAHIRQPWSLLLQVLAISLLVLAAGGIVWQAGTQRPHAHVLLLDCSSAVDSTALQREKSSTREFLSRIGANDPVMLMDVSGLVVPRTRFTTDRQQTLKAIAALSTSGTALNPDRALEAARNALQLSTVPDGDIVYAGPMRTGHPSSASSPSLRVLQANASPETARISSLTAEAGATPGAWKATVEIEPGSLARVVHLDAAYGASHFKLRGMALQPGRTVRAEYSFQADGEGQLRASIEGDAAELSLPRYGAAKVVIYTDRARELLPLFAAEPRIDVQARPTAAYNANAAADLIVLDGFTPSNAPQKPSLWLNVPNGERVTGVVDVGSHSLLLEQARRLEVGTHDVAVAAIAGAPVVVDESDRHAVKFGFDPISEAARQSASVPVLIENAMRSLLPGSFTATEFAAMPLGTQSVEVPAGVAAADVRFSVPALHRGNKILFYADRPERVEASSTNWRAEFDCIRPETAQAQWKPARPFAQGQPDRPISASIFALWRVAAVLAVALLIADWFLFGRSRRKSSWALRLACAAAIVISIAAPLWTRQYRRAAVIVIAEKPKQIAGELNRLRGRNLVAFASPREMETSLASAIAAVPDGFIPKILLSGVPQAADGSAVRAAAELAQSDIAVDAINADAAAVRIETIDAPASVYANSTAQITVHANAGTSTQAVLRIFADGKQIGQQSVALQSGENAIPADVRLDTTGAIAVKVSLANSTVTTIVDVTRPKLLFYSEDLPGTESNFLSVARTAGFAVDVDSQAVTGNTDLSAYQTIVLNNVDLNAIPEPRRAALGEFVERGGGLLLIGGERQQYKEAKNEDVLDAALPARLAPPRNPEGICVAIIIDKSSSMEGRKIDLARLSAIGVVDHLTPKDNIGVLMFDNSYEWAVPMRKATDKDGIKKLIAGIVPDGGTQIAPALAEAYRRVRKTDSAYKHIVLLTDGISEEGDSFELATEALQNHVTISTVGLGQDVNRSYLERIAALSGGKSYFLYAPQGLQQLILKDVEDYTGTTAVEKPMQPIVDSKAELLKDADMDHAPPLKGYARYEAKPDAEKLLSIDSEKHDPLLVRWQYGLGRAAVFASDAKSRWAADWITWPGFDKFWSNVLRDLATRNNVTHASADFENGDSVLRLRYRVPEGAEVKNAPEIFVLGPDGWAQAVHLHQTASTAFEARVDVGDKAGVFRARPLNDSALFPEIGAVREPRHSDSEMLRYIAEQTGGKFNPSLAEVFSLGDRSAAARVPLWPALLLCAVALDLADLVLRRLRT